MYYRMPTIYAHRKRQPRVDEDTVRHSVPKASLSSDKANAVKISFGNSRKLRNTVNDFMFGTDVAIDIPMDQNVESVLASNPLEKFVTSLNMVY